MHKHPHVPLLLLLFRAQNLRKLTRRPHPRLPKTFRRLRRPTRQLIQRLRPVRCPVRVRLHVRRQGPIAQYAVADRVIHDQETIAVKLASNVNGLSCKDSRAVGPATSGFPMSWLTILATKPDSLSGSTIFLPKPRKRRRVASNPRYRPVALQR